MYAGTKRAEINLPVQQARQLLSAQKIEIGWVVYRIREKNNLIKMLPMFGIWACSQIMYNSEDRSTFCSPNGQTVMSYLRRSLFNNNLQINLNHRKTVQELLKQTLYENKIDVVIICAQYKNSSSSTWVSDDTIKAAIWAWGDKTIRSMRSIHL